MLEALEGVAGCAGVPGREPAARKDRQRLRILVRQSAGPCLSPSHQPSGRARDGDAACALPLAGRDHDPFLRFWRQHKPPPPQSVFAMRERPQGPGRGSGGAVTHCRADVLTAWRRPSCCETTRVSYQTRGPC